MGLPVSWRSWWPMRRVNVGNKRLSPAALTEHLADVDEAETLACPEKEGARRCRRARRSRCPAARSAPSSGWSAPQDRRRCLLTPSSGAWSARICALEARFALGLRRRVDEGGFDPNGIVEEAFGQHATTRDWPTMEKILAALDG